MIQIKSRFSGWLPATKEQALRGARHLYKGAVVIKSKNKADYINTHYLRGITFSDGELRGR